MNSDEIVSLTGVQSHYEYRELIKIEDTHLSNYADKTKKLFAPIAKNFDDEKNSEWLIRSYLTLKYVLASTILGTSALYAEKENLKATLPYLKYYTMLNCARAFIFTLPCVEWRGDKSIEMTHQNIINTSSDKIKRVDASLSEEIKSTLTNSRRQREIFSYRFPATGLKLFEKCIVEIEEAIYTARLMTELAQFNLACLEAGIRKHTQSSFGFSDTDEIWSLMQYDKQAQALIDDNDYYRVDYFLRKHKHPYQLCLLATEGLVEDFFGAWVSECDDSKGYDPDDNNDLLLSIF